MMVEKLTRDGQVAVLLSPGFGAGWYSWNTNCPAMLFDPEIVQMLLDKKEKNEIKQVAEKKYPSAYLGGLRDLTVKWLDQGTQFIVDEYDGYESLTVRDSTDWMVA